MATLSRSRGQTADANKKSFGTIHLLVITNRMGPSTIRSASHAHPTLYGLAWNHPAALHPRCLLVWKPKSDQFSTHRWYPK